MKRAFSLTLLFFIASVGGASAKDQQGDAYFHFSLAKIHDLKEEYSRAVEHFEKALSLDSESVALHMEFAKTLMKMGELRWAVEECEKAITLAPAEAEPHFLLGRIYFDARRQGTMAADAITKFEKVLELQPDHADALSFLGQLYFAERNYAGAAEVFGRLAQVNPSAVRAYYSQAQALVQLGRQQEAIQVLEQGLAVRDDIPEYLESLAELYEDTGHLEEAISTYTRGGLDETNPRTAQRLARLFLQVGRPQEAIPLLREMTARFPQEVQLRVDLGRALREVVQYQEAARIFEEVLKDNPYHLEANYELAKTWSGLGERKKAIEKFEKLLDMTAAEDIQGIFKTHLALLLQETRQFDESIRLFKEVVEQKPQDLDARLRLFYSLKEASRIDEALELTEKLETENPEDLYVRIARAQALAQAGRLEEGAELLNRSLESEKESEMLTVAISQLYMTHGRLAEAQKVIEEAVSKEPANERLRFQLGAIYERQKNYEAAESQFRGLLEKNPADASVLNYLGYMLADRGLRLEEALDYIRRAVEIDPYNGAYLDSLGWAYFKLNQLAEAEVHLKKAVRLTGSDPVILEHLGDLYAQMGDTEEALRYYEQSLAVAEEEEDYQRVEQKLADSKKALGLE